MPTLFERLETGLTTDGVGSAVSGETAKLTQILGLLNGLTSGSPPGISDFSTALTSLAAPSLPNGSGITNILSSASAALPADFGAAASGAVSEIEQFVQLVTTQLGPLLANAVGLAKAVEAFGSAEFRCPPAPTPGSPPAPPAPPTPGTSTGATRLAAAAERSAQVSAMLDLLPDPLTPSSLIERAVELFAGRIPGHIVPPNIPFLDDITGPVRTLAAWSGMSAADLGASLLGSLQKLRDRIQDAGAGRLSAGLAAATALRTTLRASELQTFASDYLTHGTAMADALAAADVPTALTSAASLNTTIQGFETLRTNMASDFTAVVPGIVRQLAGLPNDILGQLLHLVVQLEPLHPGALLAEITQPAPAGSAELQAFMDVLAPVTDFLEDLAERLDFTALEGDVATVATSAQDIAGRVTAALVNVAADVRAAFSDVENAISGLDLDDLAADVRAAITSVGDALSNAITTAFAPLRDAIGSALTSISDAVDSLDFQSISDALADAVSQVTAILQDPAVVNAINEIRSALQDVADILSQLSFAPVTDEVIGLISEMEQGLRALENADLNDALKGLLDTAMQVLPPDLRPVTEPLIDDFGVHIDQGPVVFLETIRSKPQEVLDRIRAFDPGAIVEEGLGQSFEDAKTKLEGFRPSTLLTPLDQELQKQKTRLKTQAAPSRALAPVAAVFGELMAQIDRISPDAIIKPLEDAIEGAIEDAIEASPIDEIFAQVNGVFATIQGILDTVTSISATTQRLTDALTALQNPDSQMDTWRDTVLAKIDTVPNAADLNTALGEIRAALDAARHADLLAQYDAATADLGTDLTGIAAGATLASMTMLHQRLRPLVQALPAGADRTTIETVIARFDPLNPNHTGGLRAAADLANRLAATRASLAALSTDFDSVLFGPQGGLSLLRDAAGSAVGLRSIVAQDVDTALVPVRYLLAALGAAAVPVGGVAQSLITLESRLTSALANILTGPASLQSISTAIQNVVDTLRNLDLGFLRESLTGVFAEVRGQIEALDPGPLILTLDREFGDVIDTLSLTTLLPQADIQTLDDTTAALAEKFGALDPARVISDAIGPAFEADVLPLVEALDVTPLFDAIIEALRGLDEELKSELARVNTAYQSLLAARPGGDGASASVGL